MTDRPQDQSPVDTGEVQQEESTTSWFRPVNALTDEQIAQLKAAEEALVRPEGMFGPEPVSAGAWYRPPGAIEIASESPEPEPEPVVQEPVDLGEFDQDRSGLLVGISEDTGSFDPDKSGALQGITEDTGAFDPSRSSQLPGIGTDDSQEVASPFDADKSGALQGITGDTGGFDPSRSSQLPGIGTDDSQQVGVPAGITDSEQVAAVGLGDSQPVAGTEDSGQMVVDPFGEVEQKVAVLQQQFAAGAITRTDLQNELRRLMILDDQGRWWMLGLETNRWYRFDGRDWVPEEPPRPGTGDSAPIAVQMDSGPIGVGATGAEAQEGALDDSPLPARVPVSDLDATLVGQAAIELNDHRSFEAPTLQSMSVSAGETVPSSPGAFVDEFPLEGDSEQIPSVPAAASLEFTGPRMIGIQPDYSEVFGGNFDRSMLGKWALRTFIFGSVASLALAFCGVVGMLGFYFSVVNSYSETIDTIGERAGDFQTTIIYDEAGNELAQFNDPRTGARRSVPLGDISPYLIHATISTEDETFYENPGFSLFGIMRAIVRNLQTGGAGGGASTITQQLARALVLDAEFATQRTGSRKIQEIIIAAEISRKYSKNEILEFYLNEIYYGNLAYGIEVASQLYFEKPAKDLDIAEAAFLAGLPQAPAVYDPVVNPDAAKGRMQSVLRLMTEANGTGCIVMQHEGFGEFCVRQSEIDGEFADEIARVVVRRFTPPRFESKYPHYVNYVWQKLEDSYGQAIYGSGFEVYTTLRPDIQEAAQSAMLFELQPSQTPGASNSTVIVIRPRDGAVLALVGSADLNSDGLSEVTGQDIDGLVNIAFTPQQPGSSIKPFVYLGAFEGIESGEYWYPGTIIWDVESCWGNYCPRNYSGTFSGPVTLRHGLGNSLNIPAIKALSFITPESMEKILQRFAVETPLQTPVEAGLPSAVGAVEVYPFELTVAYAALANGGILHQPYTIKSIINRDGEEIFRADESPPGVAVVSPEHAYLLSNVLSDPNARFAGAGSLSIPGWQAAAKTGTTNDVRDVWVMGYTTEAAVGVWVGNTDNSPMGSGVTGANTAGPIWNTTMQAALAGLSPTTFAVPPGVGSVQVCSYTGAIYSQDTCPFGNPASEIAIANMPPPPPEQGLLVNYKVDGFSGLLANEFCDEYIEDRSYLTIDDPTAIAWLNNNPQGQAWAEAHGIEVPISEPLPQPPQEACQPGQPRPRVILSFPGTNQPVSGLTEMRGTVEVPEFASYQFQLASSTDPENFSGALGQIYTTQQPGSSALLGVVDFSQFAPGTYILRLSAQSTTGATANFDVPVVISAAVEPTPIIPTPGFFEGGNEAVPPTQEGQPGEAISPIQPLAPPTEAPQQ